jgi:hypothetical protein
VANVAVRRVLAKIRSMSLGPTLVNSPSNHHPYQNLLPRLAGKLLSASAMNQPRRNLHVCFDFQTGRRSV